MPEIISSVIIPVCDKWESTKACLESLAATLPPEICEAVVVDCASGDETAAACPALGQRLFGRRFRYLRPQKNLPFGPACNLAAKQAVGSFLVFMRNSVVAAPAWHEPLLQDFLDYDDIAAAGPVIVYPPSGPLGERVRHLGLFVSPDLTVGRLYEGIPAASQLAAKRRFFQAISGECLMLPRELFLRAGMFDESYVNGFEDVDLCARLGASGFRMTINPYSKVMYQGGYAPGGMNYELYSLIKFSRDTRRLLSPDLHGLLQADGFVPRLTEWLTWAAEMPESDRAELGVLPRQDDPLALWDVLRRHPLWHDGYLKLADILSGRQNPTAAASVLSALLKLRPIPDYALRLFQYSRAARDLDNANLSLAVLLLYCRTFDYYQKGVERVAAAASALGLRELAGQCAEWKRRENAFRQESYLPFLRKVRRRTRDLKHTPHNEWAYALWRELEHLPRRRNLPAPPADKAGAPCFSIIMPVYNPEPRHLREALDSVLAQTWPHWELCIADDASTDPQVRSILDEYARSDARVRVEYRTRNGNISEASNTAVAMAGYEYAVLMDQDDLLSPDALSAVAGAALDNPGARLFYSDEDNVGEYGGLHTPYFKGDWDPELLRGQNCISHLGVYRTETIRACGGFRVGFEGAQDHDLVLRYAENLAANEIVHIPLVLYHWRIHAKSTSAGVDAKPAALSNGVRAVQDHLDRTGRPGRAGKMGRRVFYAVKYRPPEDPPPVSVVIDLGAAPEAAGRLGQALFKLGNYRRLECLMLYDEDISEAPYRRLRADMAAYRRIRLLPVRGEMSCAKRLEEALDKAEGKILAFLGQGVVPVSPNWLEEMVARLCASGAGALGGRLLSANGTVHSLGHAVNVDGRLFSLFRGMSPNMAGFFGWPYLCRTVPSLDPRCLLVHREKLEQAGGLAPEMGEAALIDYCLMANEAGSPAIVVPGIDFVLRGEEKVAWESGAFVACAALTRKWGGRLPPCHPYLAAVGGERVLHYAD